MSVFDPCSSVANQKLATGVFQPHLHNVLKGKRLLSLEKLDRILAYLELDLRDLIEELSGPKE